MLFYNLYELMERRVRDFVDKRWRLSVAGAPEHRNGAREFVQGVRRNCADC
jgi:hypothetical protein